MGSPLQANGCVEIKEHQFIEKLSFQDSNVAFSKPNFRNVAFLSPVYTLPNSDRRAASFLSDRGYHLHHAKAIQYETLLN